MFRTDTQHALRALTVLARGTAPIPISDLATRTLSPAPMLAKILHRLARLGFVSGRTGPGGGYRLARPAPAIRLAEIVQAFEGPGFGRDCLFGLSSCSDDRPCPLHATWARLRDGLVAEIEHRTVADLVAPSKARR